MSEKDTEGWTKENGEEKGKKKEWTDGECAELVKAR